jgi:hypothetical protein
MMLIFLISCYQVRLEVLYCMWQFSVTLSFGMQDYALRKGALCLHASLLQDVQRHAGDLMSKVCWIFRNLGDICARLNSDLLSLRFVTKDQLRRFAFSPMAVSPMAEGKRW